MSGGRWALFALGALTALFAAPSFGAGPTASAVLQREIDETQGMATEALKAVSRVEIENTELRASLSSEGRNLTASDITAPMLQLGSLDVGAARSRLATLDNSIEHRESTLRFFDQEIERDGASLGDMPADSLEKLAAKAEQQKLAEARATTVELIENLGQLRVAEAQRLALTEERLALLQSRGELAAIHDNRGIESDPRAVAMRQVVSRLTRDSTALANQAAAIEPASPEGSTRKRLLDLQADDAIARATLRLGDLNLLRALSQIDFLDELSSDLSIPVRVLSDGRLELDQLQTGLDARLEALDDERLNLEGRRALIQGQSLEASEVVASQLASVQALEDLVDFQRSDLARLQERSAATVELLDTELAQRELRALGKRNALPTDAGHWALLSNELTVLPATTLRFWRGRAGAMLAQLGNASGTLLALLAAAIAILSAALWWLHRTGLRWLVAQSPDNLLSIPIEALRQWLPAFLPAIIWLTVAWGCGVDPRPTWLLGGALALWPLLGTVLGTDRLLATATAGPASRAGGWGRAALIAAAGIGVVVLVVQAVPMLPSLADLVDRAGFVGLALAGIGTWALRKTLLEALRETSALSVAAHRILEIATLAIPALLGLAAVMGIAGWVSLGWTIAAALGAVLAATALVLILAAAFNDIARMMKARVGRQRRRDRAAIDAVCRLAVVGLTVAAAWSLFGLYAQNAMATTLFWVAVIACTLPFVLQPIETLVAAFFGIDPERRPDGSVSILAICVDRGVRMLLIIGAVLGVAWIMNFDIAALASGDSLETRLVRGAFNVALVALIADFVWHLAKTMIDQRLAEEGETDAPAEIGGGEGGGQGASRLQTLLPLFRKFLMITLAVMDRWGHRVVAVKRRAVAFAKRRAAGM